MKRNTNAVFMKKLLEIKIIFMMMMVRIIVTMRAMMTMMTHLRASKMMVTIRVAFKLDFWKKLGIWTKFVFVNGQKCDEAHNT